VNDQEAALVRLAQQGDADAFSGLLDMYQRPVFNLCYRMLGDPAEAEDAAQETFLRAYRSLNKYDNSRSFATWLLSIAAHYCIDQARRRRMSFVSIDDTPGLDVPDLAPLPESALTRRQELARIHAMLDKLGLLDRAAVVMYYWYECSYEEIAEALSLTVSAVKSRLHRARRDMAEHWLSHNDTTPLSALPAAEPVAVERSRNDRYQREPAQIRRAQSPAV
jgi:RNA polymerase sigma-70 factor (ECF subfamily)